MTFPVSSSPTGVDFDAVAGAAPGELNEEELRQVLVQADRVRARLDAAVTGLVGAFDGRSAWAADGARGPAPWLAARTQTSASGWRRELRLALALRDMPLVEAAAREGRLSRDKVLALVWARQPGLEDAFAWCEEQLVQEVEAPTVAGAWRYLRRWVLSMRELLGLNEPDGPEPGHGTGGSKVTLSSAFEGRWFGTLDLTPEDGEVIATAVDHQIQAMWDQHVFQGDDGLSAPERRAMALVEVVRRGTRGGADDGTARPLLLGIVGLEDLLRRQPGPGEPVASGADDGADPRSVPSTERVPGPEQPGGDGVTSFSEKVMALAELALAGPVDLEMMRRLACEGDVAPVIIGEDGVPLSMGRRIRLANRHQRRALRIRDGHCAFAGCTVAAPQCIAHHLLPWEDGGPTDLVNLCLLCRFHHRAVHEGGFRIGWEGGVLVTYRPDGTPILDARPDGLALRRRHRPPPITPRPIEALPPDERRAGPRVNSPPDPLRWPSGSQSEDEVGGEADDVDAETLYMHRCARARIDALIIAARARRRLTA